VGPWPLAPRGWNLDVRSGALASRVSLRRAYLRHPFSKSPREPLGSRGDPNTNVGTGDQWAAGVAGA